MDKDTLLLEEFKKMNQSNLQGSDKLQRKSFHLLNETQNQELPLDKKQYDRLYTAFTKNKISLL